MTIKKFTIATLATLMLSGSVFAQQAQPPRTQERQSQTNQDRNQSHASQAKDQTLAQSLTITNQAQVLLSRFAKDQAKHADVIEFATKLEKEHQECLEQLQQFSTQSASSDNKANQTNQTNQTNQANQADRVNQADNTRQTETTERTESTSAQVNDQTSKVDFLQLHQQISAQCLKDSMEMLGSKEGAEFDKCFVGMQVALHANMNSTLTVLERHTSGKLQELIKSDLAKNAKHMEVAIRLMDKLVTGVPTNSSR